MEKNLAILTDSVWEVARACVIFTVFGIEMNWTSVAVYLLLAVLVSAAVALVRRYALPQQEKTP